MKKILLFICIIGMALGSCKAVYHSKGADLPPGQAKKITGSQSAKPHAPGQQKKNGRG